MAGRLFIAFASLFLVADGLMAVGIPFRMPLSAIVTDRSVDGKGWREGGVMTTPLAAARQSFKSSLLSCSWRCVHVIPMDGNDRVIALWRRGGEELTLMLWRIDVNRTGFSWGVSSQPSQRQKRKEGMIRCN